MKRASLDRLGKFAATRRVIIVGQPGVVRGRVYRFDRVGREKYPAARTVRLQKAAGGSGNPALSGFRGIFFARST